MLSKCFLIGCLLLFATSCVREVAYLHTPEESRVFISGSSGRPSNLWYSIRIGDSIEISVQVLRHYGLNERLLPGSLLLDLSVTPRAEARFITYRPENIRVVVLGDTLPMIDSKVTYGYPNTCYHRAVFEMKKGSETGEGGSPDSVWCRVDLTGVLLYKGTSIEIGPLVGRLSK